VSNSVSWATAEAITTALSTGLNSLANGALSANSGTIANSTGLFRFINLEVALASLTPTAGAYLTILILYTMDGTNFADSSSSNVFAQKATFTPSTSTGAKRLIMENVPIAPLDFQLVLLNQTGVALNASGNTVKYMRHNEQINP